jgi:hypothetical protein
MVKHYNPFKMWGSWVGAVIGLVSMFLGFDLVSGYILHAVNLMSNSVFFLIASYSIPIILGFLVGWGIHSLVRKYS